MLIIIDGYNFMFTVPELERYAETNRIEPVRDHVISLFSRYKGKKHYDVTIVFDGTHAEVVLPKKQICSGITVIYSKSGIDADTEIKKITSLCQNPKDVCIVTYDNDIKRHVKKCGCHIIEPKDMYKKILDILNKEKKDPSGEPEDKRNGHSENDAEYWKDVFKEIPHEEMKQSIQKTILPAIKKGEKKPLRIEDEPFCKYQGTPADETQYWLRIFKEIGNDEQKD